MKTLFKPMTFCLTAILSLALISSCGSNDDVNNNVNGETPSSPSQPVEPTVLPKSTLCEIVEQQVYDPANFGQVVGSWPMLSVAGDAFANLMKTTLNTVARTRLLQMDRLFKERVGTTSGGSRQWNIKRYVFTYKSVSNSTGNDTILTGSVIFPNNTIGKPHQLDILTLYHHQAYFADAWLASRNPTVMALHALNNSAVIEPDGQGASEDLEKLITEVLYGDLSCLQMVDCVLAALEVMNKEQVTLAPNGYTNNWGTSLGTASATGFAQYMENDATPELQQLLKLRATYIGEGPIKFSQLTDCKQYEPYLPVQKYFDGWNPRLPFYMSCCKDDELIVYDELKQYFVKLRTMPDGSVNNNVQWCDFYLPSIISKITSSKEISEATWGVGNHYLTAVVSLIFASTVKDPADMEKVLISNNAFDEGQNQ